MGTIRTVAGSNRLEIYFKMFAFWTQSFSRNFVDFFTRNYFCFLYNVFHKWAADSNVESFYKLDNKLYPDLQFILYKYLHKTTWHSIL